jgi:hypothetical protein
MASGGPATAARMYREQLCRRARSVGTVGLLPELNGFSFETEEYLRRLTVRGGGRGSYLSPPSFRGSWTCSVRVFSSCPPSHVLSGGAETQKRGQERSLVTGLRIPLTAHTRRARLIFLVRPPFSPPRACLSRCGSAHCTGHRETAWLRVGLRADLIASPTRSPDAFRRRLRRRMGTNGYGVITGRGSPPRPPPRASVTT